jgi:heme exporter protein B
LLKALIQKEIQLEWRQKAAINGILLYLISTIFVCYLSFGLKSNVINPISWNALYWIIILFAAVNSVAKSFIGQGAGRQLYYYTIASPQHIIIAKVIYNSVMLVILALIGFGCYSLVMGSPVTNHALFVINILLASTGFSTTLTMVSGIASKANNSTTLMAILSFPIILPMLMMVIKISKNAIDGLDWSNSVDELLTLVAINLIVGAVTYLLFPYLWRN